MYMDNDYVVKNGKELKKGYTTGSCATAASMASAQMLITGEDIISVYIAFIGGGGISLAVEDVEITSEYASCVVVKDAGDDPDVTHNARIKSKVSFSKDGSKDRVNVFGGKGVGIVTAPGLQCAVGEAAINPVPMQMIKQNVRNTLDRYGCKKSVDVEISVENGEEIAKKTFNPRLGIVGGISILGTTGIVEPMSEKALIDTIKIMVDKQKTIDTENILIAPGNYGKTYCEEVLHISIDNAVKISNFIGEALDYIGYKGFKNVLLVGHIGKLVKLAGAIMNTHSSVADCRMEIIGVHLALAGGTKEQVSAVMQCVTTDTAIDIVENSGLGCKVWQSIIDKIKFHLDYRTRQYEGLNVEVIMFKTDDSMIACTKGAKKQAQHFKNQGEIGN